MTTLIVPFWVWILTVGLIVGLLAFDYFFHVRAAHTPTLKEAAVWYSVYVSVAIIFGIAFWVVAGRDWGMQYFAGYITEEALSVDNLFVFLILMSSFKVPRADQQKVLLFGIGFSLIARAGFIFLGAALINSFSWIFYVFGLILLVTAGNLLRPETEEENEDEANNVIIRLAKRYMHTTSYYDGDRFFTTVDGKRAMTPMLLVMVAIGGTDVLFALDSIPAIFGLTQSTYIVFTATAFSLMGLRQLYFLIDGLLDRLIYLTYGLAAILAFIGVKLILHAMHENSLPFINAGDSIPTPEITTGTSLMVIVAALTITITLSLLSPKGKALTIINNARRHAEQYLDLTYESDPAQREQIFRRLLQEEARLLYLPARFDHLIADEERLLTLLEQTHDTHDRYIQHFSGEYPDGDPFWEMPRLVTASYRKTPASPETTSGSTPDSGQEGELSGDPLQQQAGAAYQQPQDRPEGQGSPPGLPDRRQ